MEGAAILDNLNTKLTPPLPPLPPILMMGKMERFGFSASSLLIGGEGSLICYLILKKIAVSQCLPKNTKQ